MRLATHLAGWRILTVSTGDGLHKYNFNGSKQAGGVYY
jgi:hypothetical protein